MYLTNFNIGYRPHAVELNTILSDLGHRVNRTKNHIVVISDNHEKATNALKEGNEFLNSKDDEFESWVYEESEYFEEEINSPYDEYGITESMFYTN